MSLYVDVRITGNDLSLDEGGEPLLLADRDSIAQDLKHLVRESGLLVEIVGERDRAVVADRLAALARLIDEDVRLVAGSVAITRPATETFYIAADTVDFGPLGFEVQA